MWEKTVIPFVKNNYLWLSRVSFFIIYFWFGILKLVGQSPASPLVQALQEKALPLLSFQQFIIFFALFEMFIGLLFLFTKYTRLVFALFIIHMGMTLLPLFLVPSYSWSGFLTPTIEGQYMIKNLILISLACSILVNTKKKN